MLTIYKLLQTYGLIHGLSEERVRWFESTASGTGIIDEGDEDFDIIVAAGILEGDYVYFRADSEVMDSGVHDEQWVTIVDTGSVHRVFNVYKVLTIDEVLRAETA